MSTAFTHSCCDARFERGVADDRLGGMSFPSRKHWANVKCPANGPRKRSTGTSIGGYGVVGGDRLTFKPRSGGIVLEYAEADARVDAEDSFGGGWEGYRLDRCLSRRMVWRSTGTGDGISADLRSPLMSCLGF